MAVRSRNLKISEREIGMVHQCFTTNATPVFYTQYRGSTDSPFLMKYARVVFGAVVRYE